MPQETQLEQIRTDLKRVSQTLRSACETVKDEDVSNYPIVLAHQADPPLGIDLLKAEVAETLWSYKITTLEELYARNVIPSENLDNFKQLYKAKDNALCLLVVDEHGANFVFVEE